MGYPTTAITLWTPKTADFSPVPEGVPLTEAWDYDDVTKLQNALNTLDGGISGGDWHGLVDKTSLPPELAATGKMRTAYLDGRPKWSREGKAWTSLTRGDQDVPWDYFNIKANGSADDTSAWMDALNYFGDPTKGGNGKTGRLILPVTGVSLVSGLTYYGSVSYWLWLYGLGSGQGQTGFKFQMTSTSAVPVLRMVGMNNCRLSGFSIDGNRKAKYLVHIDNWLDTGTSFYPSSTNLLEDLSLYNHGGDNCAVVAIGNASAPNTQTSEVTIRKSLIYGRATDGDCKGKGIQVNTQGNCKNFRVDECEFNQNGVHVDLGSSGYATVHGGSMGVCGVAAIIGGGNTHIDDVDYEGDVGGAHPAPLYGGGGGGTNPSYKLTITNCEVFAPLQTAGGAYSEDDVMVIHFGNIILMNNTFGNLRGDGSHESRVVCSSGTGFLPPAAESGSVISMGNWYRNSQTYAPIYDTSGNLIAGADYSTISDHNILSIGDIGGQEGSDATKGVRALRNVIGNGLERTRHRMRNWQDTYAASILADGNSVESGHQKRIGNGSFYADTSWKGVSVANLNPGQRCKGCRIRVDTPFTGVTGGVTLQVGFNPPGVLTSGEMGMRGIYDMLLACDVSGAAAGTVYGGKPDEMGVSLHPAVMNPNGMYPALADVNNGWVVTMVAISPLGNPLHITAGQVTLTLVTENDP